jgi:hypothetical protein
MTSLGLDVGGEDEDGSFLSLGLDVGDDPDGAREDAWERVP